MGDLKFIHHLKNLKFLILEYNSISNIEDNFARLKKLEILHLGHNSLNKLDTHLLKSNMNYLKILDLSFNRLNTIAIEIFMLPHLEMLNLSNNKISMLPIMPTSYFRTIAICVCDLSTNKLIRFYEFLLSVCDRIDLTSNKIKTIPMKAFEKLTNSQLENKMLKIDKNPLIDPPQEFCKHGLKVMKKYFEEAQSNIQLNKGFKMILLGENNSGKTQLAHALEDYNSQSNLVEQFEMQSKKVFYLSKIESEKKIF